MHEAFGKVWDWTRAACHQSYPPSTLSLPGFLLAYPMTVTTACILASLPRLVLFVVPAVHQLHGERTDATRQLHLEATHF